VVIEAASSYPLANALWTMFEFFAFVIWIWLLFAIFSDLFRRDDLSGWATAGWTIFVLVVPLIGVLVYMITQSSGMSDRSVAQERKARGDYEDYVRSITPTQRGATEEISRAKDLLDTGAITTDEYDALKQKALAS
jgi:hypothetical protein